MKQVILTSGVSINEQDFHLVLKKIINQTYKLLPMRQEEKDWEKPLQTLIEELAGMKRLINGQDDLFFLILCKMEGLFSLQGWQNMSLYRRVIFECLSLLNELDRNVNTE